jgi:hypothetical protein
MDGQPWELLLWRVGMQGEATSRRGGSSGAWGRRWSALGVTVLARKGSSPCGLQWRGGGSACTRKEGTVLPFYTRLTLVKVLRKSFTTAHHSMGAAWRRAWGKVRRGEQRRAGDRRPMAYGGAPSGGWGNTVWHRPRARSVSRTEIRAQPTDRWSPACPGTRVRRGSGGPTRTGDVARVLSHSQCQMFWRSPVRLLFSPKRWTEVHQGLNRKVVDLASLYNFYKWCMGFFSTIFAQIACQDADFLGASEQWRIALTEVFHLFMLQISNATQHESCVPWKTTQLLYWENLKCLGEIWRTWQKFRTT